MNIGESGCDTYFEGQKLPKRFHVRTVTFKKSANLIHPPGRLTFEFDLYT